MAFNELVTATINCSGTTQVFMQRFQAAQEDKYCAVYSVKWLRKRVGARNFFSKTVAGEARQSAAAVDPAVAAQHPAIARGVTLPQPSTTVAALGTFAGTSKVGFNYRDAGPSADFRTKVTGYRQGWLANRPDTETEAVATLNGATAAAEFGFHPPAQRQRKLAPDLAITKHDFLELLDGALPPYLAQRIVAAGAAGPAYFYLSWDGHATACSLEDSGFYWFDPAHGEFQVARNAAATWLAHPGVVAYINALLRGSTLDIVGFRRA